MNNADEIIKALGGPTKVGAALGSPITTVNTWQERNSIPAKYWPAIVAEAERHAIGTITFSRLAELAAERLKPKQQPPT